MFVSDPQDRPILGIDPGLTRMGYGAVVRAGSAARAVSAGVITTDPALDLPARLGRLSVEIEALLDDIAPRAMAVERVLFQVNVRTAISVGQASGLAIAAAARRSIPVVQYSPNEVKLSVTGDGAASKQAVQMMVAKLLGLAAVPDPPDAADALALALCHAWRDRVESARSAATAGASPNLGSQSNRQTRIEAAIAKTAKARK